MKSFQKNKSATKPPPKPPPKPKAEPPKKKPAPKPPPKKPPPKKSPSKKPDPNEQPSIFTRLFTNPPPPGKPVSFGRKTKLFFVAHWRGFVIIMSPLLGLPILLPNFEHYQWCAYTLIVMASYWVTECIPLPVTAFLPILVFPMTGVMSTLNTCKCYINDTIIMFWGSLVLAYAIEQSGLHIRVALACVRCIGYSHYKLLFTMCFVTMFISMWITNSAATTMMVPIMFAILRVFEKQRMIVIFEASDSGERRASDITTCYFCAITYSATIGGIGTLVGTATNLVFKGLLIRAFPDAPEYLSFPLFSAFTIPYMLLLEISTYIYLIFVYLGCMRPRSQAALRAMMTPEAVEAAKQAVEEDWKKLGKITFWEILSGILFCTAMALFFCRSPQMFLGWADLIAIRFDSPPRFIKDSAVAMMLGFFMMLLPANLNIFKNFTAKNIEDLPKGKVRSVLDWYQMNKVMPYSFMFLLGGGFALSRAAGAEYSNLNGQIGKFLKELSFLPNSFIILLLLVFTIFLTNFASNVAVCNVVTPIAMQMVARTNPKSLTAPDGLFYSPSGAAKEISINPLWYNIVTGLAASYCFMLPVGTPGNLIVQSAALIPTNKMMLAGAGPTVTTIIISWAAFVFWAPIIWPDLHSFPAWAKV